MLHRFLLLQRDLSCSFSSYSLVASYTRIPPLSIVGTTLLCLLAAPLLGGTQVRADDSSAITLSGLPDSALDEGQALGPDVGSGRLRRTIRRMSPDDLRGLVTGATLDLAYASSSTAYLATQGGQDAERRRESLALFSGLDLILGVTAQNGQRLDTYRTALEALQPTDPCVTGGCRATIANLGDSNLKLNGTVATLVDLIEERAAGIAEISSSPRYGGSTRLGRDSVRGVVTAVIDAHKAIILYGTAYERLPVSCTTTGCTVK